MNLISLKCPNCDAIMEVNSELKTCTCAYCGNQLFIETDFDKGYENESGRIKAREDQKIRLEKKEQEEIFKYGRVESLSGKEINHTMFNLFGRLIGPVTSYENACIEEEELVAKRKGLPRAFFKEVTKLPIFIVACIVICFAITCILELSDKSISGIRYRKLPAEERTIYEEKEGKENGYEMYLVYGDDPLYCFITGKEPFDGGVHFFRGGIKKGIVVEIVWVILVLCYDIFFLIRSTSRLKYLRKKQEEISDGLRDFIKYVPPSYRNSAALSYFYDSYSNSRVDNLKEAIQAFDAQERHCQVMSGLASIEQATLTLASEISELNGKMSMLAAEVFLLS